MIPTDASPPVPLHFPYHAQSRTWLLTSAASPLGIALTRVLLEHGDSAVLCAAPAEVGGLAKGRSIPSVRDGLGAGRALEFARFVREEVEVEEQWRERWRVVELDGRIIGQCQAAVAEAVEAFGKIDILFCCASEAVIGTVEELAASQRTLTLVREQFETNFFGPVNMIKAVLPAMREKRSGHVIVLTASHLGTPGLGIYCASGWALEGFCDSLAYEIAPFNIKMTILQPNLEINVLTNKISSAPLLRAYSPSTHPAPLARSLLGGLLDRLNPQTPPSDAPSPTSAASPTSSTSSAPLPRSLHDSEKVEVVYPDLPAEMEGALLAETIHALAAVGGHENPPGRHIVGYEAVASVKEKLKTVSEELEDFVEVSAAVDIEEGGQLEADDL